MEAYLGVTEGGGNRGECESVSKRGRSHLNASQSAITAGGKEARVTHLTLALAASSVNQKTWPGAAGLTLLLGRPFSGSSRTV